MEALSQRPDLVRSDVLETEVVVDCVAQFLFATQITFGGLNRCVPKQELDLLQFTASQMAQARTSASQIMRSKVLDASALGRGFHDVPNRLWCDPAAPDFAEPVYSPEDWTFADFSGNRPFIHLSLYPRGDRDSADMLAFDTQVGNNPMFLPNLKVFCSQPDK